MNDRERLQKIAKELRDEADNLSPTSSTHPAPALRKWADQIEAISKNILD